MGGTAHGTVRVAAKRGFLAPYALGITDEKEHIFTLSTALAAFAQSTRQTIDEAALVKTEHYRPVHLRDTSITTLPDNLSVGGDLNLRDTGITARPDNLKVGGSLYLRGTGISALPDNLSVGGHLYLDGTGITTLPANLSVGGRAIGFEPPRPSGWLAHRR